MRGTRKLFLVSMACAGIVMGLLLTAVVTTHLLANREMVKTFIVTKTAQATGDKLEYDRLDISFFPLPHLEARGIHLRRADAFEIHAQSLSVYPRLLAIPAGRISIRRLVLDTPDITFRPSQRRPNAPAPDRAEKDRTENAIRMAIEGLFGALGTIDPGTALQVKDGSLTWAFTDAPDLQVKGIDAQAANNDGDLLLNLACRSQLTGDLELEAHANMENMQAGGKVRIGGINLRPLLANATLPAGITIADTRTTVEATVTVSSPETVHSRFGLRFPSLTVMRKGRQLDLEGVVIAGTADYADKQIALSVDSLQSAQPPLNLSATTRITPAGNAGRSTLEVDAAARQLDVAVASKVTRAIAGDLDAIRTAFNVARQGVLTDATYFAAFDVDPTGWQLTKMKAAGHLAQGLITIPGIEADLERMDGDVVYEDKGVAFKKVSGHFKGATFEDLEAAIDWEKQSTLTIACPSVNAEVAPMHNWLTSFEGLNGFKKYIATATGNATFSKMEISGPLTQPSQWSFNISGTPETVTLKSPLVPFEVKLSGGQITYIPGQEHADDVRVDFLDGSFVSSGQTKGIINPESLLLRIDGSMGQATIDWLGTILPIPDHLKIKPPVDLSGVGIAWDYVKKTMSFTGGMKTGGGVALFADFTHLPEAWQIRKIQFSDGRSKATASARIQDNTIELAFSGSIDSQTADRLLKDNRTLSGRMEGDFRSVINTAVPLNSKFTGKLSGEGLHLQSIVRDPIEVIQFAIEGQDNQLTIAPSKVSLLNSLMVVDGMLDRSGNGLVFDLNVNADRLDEALIRALQPATADNTETMAKQEPPAMKVARGDIHLNVTDFTYRKLTWSPLEADIRLDGDRIHIRIDKADLCGISTTGEIDVSPQGLAFTITPEAMNVALQQTDQCLWQMPIKADATYDLTGVIKLPRTREEPIPFISGQLDFVSENGKIVYANVTTKIISYLKMTDVFAGGKSDLAEEGFGYATAHIKAEIGGGQLLLNEILVDGDALKLTGRGTFDLQDATADIILLAAPLKTVDRVVNELPIINYIAGGSLISIPIRIEGKWNDLHVVPMAPADVGRGLLNIMERTLKAPFKLVEAEPAAPPVNNRQKGP